MGSRVFPNPKCWQLRTPYSLCHSWKTPRAVSFWPLRNVTDSNSAMPCRLVNGSAFYGSRNLRVQRVKRACSTHFDDFPNEEMLNTIQEVERKLDLTKEEDDHVDENGKEIAYSVSENTQHLELKNVSDRVSSKQFWTMKPDLLDPSLLGIQPEPPSWPERDEILRLNFERRVNSLEIPLSIRMIKKKLQWQKGFEEASELTSCSVKKTFNSMLFIIHELQNHALQSWERLCCEDLQGVMAKLNRQRDASFVWLFQRVFWKTPTLMVYLMVLLADFSVFSTSNNTVMAVTPSSMNNEVPSFTDNKSKQQYSQVDADVDQDECRNEEQAKDEVMLWNSMREEASKLQKELGTAVLDNETMQRFVSPVSVKLEGDQYEEYVKTELYYKKHLRRSPHNSLLLSNYALLLFLVFHDLDGAEEYFKRSVMVESPEAEAFSRYGDFLWLVRQDLWAAELRYQQAWEADPGNTYYSSKYASLVWNNCGQDTSFPIEEFDNLQL